MHEDLPHAMRETARRLEPDVVRLAAGGVSRGTRMRRMERAVQVLGSAVAVALVFAGVVLFGGHGTGSANQAAVSGSVGTPATDVPSTPSPTATRNAFATATATATAPSPTRTGKDDDSGTGTAQISGNDLIVTLKSALAGTGVTGSSFLGHSSSPITVAAGLSAKSYVGSIDIVISGPRDFAPQPGTPQPLPDGSIVYVEQAAGTSDGRHFDRIDLDVTLVRPDGSSLAARETNAVNAKSAAVPGTPLLLPAKQVIAMLDSPAWDAAVAVAAVAHADAPAVPSSTYTTALPPRSSQ